MKKATWPGDAVSPARGGRLDRWVDHPDSRRGVVFIPALLSALALAACAPHPRYVSVYCVSPDQLQRLKDAEPPRVGDRLTGQAQDDFKIAAGSAVELRSYSHGLLGVLEGCVEPKVSTIGDK